MSILNRVRQMHWGHFNKHLSPILVIADKLIKPIKGHVIKEVV